MTRKVGVETYNDSVFYRDKNKKDTTKCMNNSLAVFAAIVIIAVAGVAIAAIIIDAEQNALQRYCIDIDDGGLIGAYSINSNDRTMAWEFQHTMAILNAVTSIHIKGPIPTGSLDGPLTTSLCGVPSTLACDTSVPGELSGIIDQTNPGAVSLKETIKEMRAAIWRYYIEFSDGITTVRAPLNMICGTP